MKKTLLGILIFTLICVSSFVVYASDIEGHWAEADYERMESVGVVTDETNPDAYITRGEFVAMIVKLFEPTQVADLSGYEDIAKDSPYYDDFAKAVAMGAIKGFSATELGPNEPITREQAMVVLNRVIRLKANGSESEKYTDSEEVSSWAKDAVEAFTEFGIVNGYEDGSVRPEGFITKAEATKIINRSVPKIITEPGEYDLSDVEGCVLVKCEDVTLTNADPEKIIVTNSEVKDSLEVEGVAEEDIIVVSELEKEDESSTGTGSTSGDTTTTSGDTASSGDAEEKPAKTSGGSSSSSTKKAKLSKIIFEEKDNNYLVIGSGEVIAEGNDLIVTLKALDGTEKTISAKDSVSKTTYGTKIAGVVGELDADKAINTIIGNSTYNTNSAMVNWGVETVKELEKTVPGVEAAARGLNSSVPAAYTKIMEIDGATNAEIMNAAKTAASKLNSQDTLFTSMINGLATLWN